jgi:hypothetical protein
MMPILRDGKVFRPIVPSRIVTNRGVIMVDAMEEVLPGDPECDGLRAWLGVTTDRK